MQIILVKRSFPLGLGFIEHINTGGAGLEEWINAFQSNYQDWEIHYSDLIANSPNYIKIKAQRD